MQDRLSASERAAADQCGECGGRLTFQHDGWTCLACGAGAKWGDMR
jgi:hypothetical protein